MSELTSKKCAPCEGGMPALSRAAAQNLMQELGPEWKLANDAKSIASEWKFRNFFHTMSFVNAVAHVANAEDHHPDPERGAPHRRKVCRIRQGEVDEEENGQRAQDPPRQPALRRQHPDLYRQVRQGLASTHGDSAAAPTDADDFEHFLDYRLNAISAR